MEWKFSQFCQRFEQALKKAHKQKRQVAKIIDIDAAVLSGWNRGRSRPSLPQIVQMAEFLGVGPAWLAFGIGGQKGFSQKEEEDLSLLNELQPAQREGIRQMMRLLICASPRGVSEVAQQLPQILKVVEQGNLDLKASYVQKSNTPIVSKSPAPESRPSDVRL